MPKKPARSYMAILAGLLKAKADELKRERMPQFELGMPTKRMLALQREYKAANSAKLRAEHALEKLDVSIDYDCSLNLHYRKTRVLSDAWRTRHNEKTTKLAQLRVNAMLDLLDMPPAKAKRYLKRVQHTLRTL